MVIRKPRARLHEEWIRPDEDIEDVLEEERDPLINDELDDDAKVRSRALSTALEQMAQQRKEAEERRKSVIRAYRDLSGRMFCRSCGVLVTRKDHEDNTAWSKRRRCDTCIANNVETDARHCRHCGTLLNRDQYLAKKGNTLLGWNTVARCEDCKGAVKDMRRQARTHSS